MPVTKSSATKLTFYVYTAHMREGFGFSCALRDTGHCRGTRRSKNWSSVVWVSWPRLGRYATTCRLLKRWYGVYARDRVSELTLVPKTGVFLDGGWMLCRDSIADDEW